MYKVFEIFPDGAKILRFENCDRFECEVYIAHHQYDYSIIRAKSTLTIEL
jgi:hypothetical protein